ncbi:MAG: adenylate cyclase, partial [Limisphaerales bacterium]
EHADDPEKVEAYSDLMAQESLSNVNIYLGAISNMVKKHNGTLDKYMGDCVMAFWGAPTENEQHALSCVRASVDGQRAMHRLNLERMAENQKRKKLNVERIKNGEEPLDMLKLLSLGSGINSGVCIVGLMGSDQHILNFTVFGREVNLASRLEAVSGRGRIIIGENTYNEIKSYAPEFLEDCKPLQPVTVKGIENPVPIYEVPWMENWEEREALELEIIGEVIPLKPAAALVYDAKPKAQSLDDA